LFGNKPTTKLTRFNVLFIQPFGPSFVKVFLIWFTVQQWRRRLHGRQGDQERQAEGRHPRIHRRSSARPADGQALRHPRHPPQRSLRQETARVVRWNVGG
jgi:hypothetical protein